MIGPWHLPCLDGAVDRRRAETRHGARPVETWHGRVMTGPHVVWPPVDRDQQAEYARRVVEAKRAGAALVTVLHRRGATCVVVIDVYGRPLDDGEQAAVRRVLERLTPAPFFGIRPWVAVQVGPWGGLTTNAVEREHDPEWLDDPDVDRLGPALEQLAWILADAPTRALA
jgi:hypothetical protein